jgi:hypothetical protein
MRVALASSVPSRFEAFRAVKSCSLGEFAILLRNIFDFLCTELMLGRSLSTNKAKGIEQSGREACFRWCESKAGASLPS